MCYVVGPCWLSVLYIIVCICKSHTLTYPSHLPFDNLKFVSYICKSISVL